MDREFFMETQRLGFSVWRSQDMDLARLLWGDKRVTRYICASGAFSDGDISERLSTEIKNGARYNVQYWPVFELSSRALVGCCGLRPRDEGIYEIGFHLRPEYWNKGYAAEAARRVIDYTFSELNANALFAGHHPENGASERLLGKLGFRYIGAEYYAPTGLYHPSYELLRK